MTEDAIYFDAFEERIQGADVLVINLNPGRWTECAACEAATPVGQGLPVDDTGDFVNNDYEGDWAGVPACKRCYDVHAAGGVAALEAMLKHEGK